MSEMKDYTHEIDELREEITKVAEEHEKFLKALRETQRVIELAATPKQVLAKAQEVAAELMGILKRRTDWIVEIEGKDYLTFNAFQFVGALMQLFPSVESIRELKDETGKVVGFEVTAVVRNRFGEELSRAVGRADRNEKVAEWEWIIDERTGKKRRGRLLGYRQRFDERTSDHALMALAQTRAMRRALYQLLNFVVALAGYEEKPAEEILEASQ